MSDATLETISIWLFAPSLAVIAAVAIVSYTKSPRRTHPGRRSKQIESLRSQLQSSTSNQAMPCINWLDYKELTKAELKDIAAEYSLQYVDQEITSAGWLVRFSTSQGTDDENRTG